MEQKEPSMEEILSSIRRILSHEEETATSADEELKTTVSASALESAKDDVMELTEQMRVDKETSPKAETVRNDIPDDMVLLSEEAVQASADRLSQFVSSVVQEKKQPEPVKKSDSDSLEDIVTTLLRPYLKEWLDANLPALVEKIVQKEVKQLAQKVKLS